MEAPATYKRRHTDTPERGEQRGRIVISGGEELIGRLTHSWLGDTCFLNVAEPQVRPDVFADRAFRVDTVEEIEYLDEETAIDLLGASDDKHHDEDDGGFCDCERRELVKASICRSLVDTADGLVARGAYAGVSDLPAARQKLMSAAEKLRQTADAILLDA